MDYFIRVNPNSGLIIINMVYNKMCYYSFSCPLVYFCVIICVYY